jgi:hypothetical protein
MTVASPDLVDTPERIKHFLLKTPMSLDGRIGNLDRSSVSIDYLLARLPVFAGMARAAHAPFRPQIVHQLFFQYALE